MTKFAIITIALLSLTTACNVVDDTPVYYGKLASLGDDAQSDPPVIDACRMTGPFGKTTIVELVSRQHVEVPCPSPLPPRDEYEVLVTDPIVGSISGTSIVLSEEPGLSWPMYDSELGRKYLVSYRETRGLNIVHFAVEITDAPVEPGNDQLLNLPTTMDELKRALLAAAVDPTCDNRFPGLHRPIEELTRNWGDTDCTGEIIAPAPVEDGNGTDL